MVPSPVEMVSKRGYPCRSRHAEGVSAHPWRRMHHSPVASGCQQQVPGETNMLPVEYGPNQGGQGAQHQRV